jgi:cyclase
MLRTRVIPVVLIDGYSVVKTIGFNERRNQGNPITVARIYNSRNVDELILLDIDASKDGRSIDLFTIEEIASECFMPLAVGGGIRTLEDIRNVLDRGADKVVINTAAINDHKFVTDAVRMFGAQCIVGSVDVVKTDNEYRVYSMGEISSRDAIEWIVDLEKLGVGEIFVNSVDRDGAMSGCDEELISRFVKKIKVPVIYAGGVGNPEDCIGPIKQGCSAVAIASMFHFTSFTPNSVKEVMFQNGIPVRL